MGRSVSGDGPSLGQGSWLKLHSATIAGPSTGAMYRGVGCLVQARGVRAELLF